MSYKLEEAGRTGVINGVQFALRNVTAGHSTLANAHNIAGLLTESASAKLASPIYIHPSQLTGGEGVIRAWAKSGQAQSNHPNPWSGGWWHLRDIVEQKKMAAWALLDMAARNRITVLKNRYLKSKRQTERGEQENPYAYIIAPEQHDPLTTIKLIDKLLLQGIEVKQASREFTAAGIKCPKGSYIISLAQPKMAAIKVLLGQTLYPDDEFTRQTDGTPLLPGDVATDSLNEFMGINVKSIDTKFEADLKVIKEIAIPKGKLTGSTSTGGYILDGRLNDSFKACNQLLSRGIKVKRLDEAVIVKDQVLPPGAFFISIPDKNAEKDLKEIAADTGIDFQALDGKPKAKSHEINQPRIGVFQRYWGGNMEEGWTEWVLEEFGFAYTILKDADIKNGSLSDKFDVIVLPSDTTPFITGDEKELEKWFEERGSRMGISMTTYPPEYRSGIGEDGTKALKSFVEDGGTLVPFNETSNYAVEHLKLPVKNVVKDLPTKEYANGGSTINLCVDNGHPLGYGMPESSQILVRANSPVFSIAPAAFNERCEVIIGYPVERDPRQNLLRSGWLIGEELLYGKIAMLSVNQGKGKVILIGFSPQFKGQTHSTFKILFNCLLG